MWNIIQNTHTLLVHVVLVIINQAINNNIGEHKDIFKESPHFFFKTLWTVLCVFDGMIRHKSSPSLSDHIYHPEPAPGLIWCLLLMNKQASAKHACFQDWRIFNRAFMHRVHESKAHETYIYSKGPCCCVFFRTNSIIIDRTVCDLSSSVATCCARQMR